MANLLGKSSNISGQNNRNFLDSLHSKLLIFPWLNTTKIDHNTLSVDIAAMSAAPISTWVNKAGDLCFVIGYMFPQLTKEDSQAKYLLSHFSAGGISAFDANGDLYLAH